MFVRALNSSSLLSLQALIKVREKRKKTHKASIRNTHHGASFIVINSLCYCNIFISSPPSDADKLCVAFAILASDTFN